MPGPAGAGAGHRPACVDPEAAVAGAACPLQGFVSPLHFGAGTKPAPRARHCPPRGPCWRRPATSDGLTLTLDCPTRLPDEAERLTEALATQLAEIGVRLHVRISIANARTMPTWSVARKSVTCACSILSPLSTFRVLYEKIDARVAGSWWQGYAQRAVEALIDQGRSHDRRCRPRYDLCPGLWADAAGSALADAVQPAEDDRAALGGIRGFGYLWMR
jgi:peptide/nickel transport system substrate-binding protein